MCDWVSAGGVLQIKHIKFLGCQKEGWQFRWTHQREDHAVLQIMVSSMKWKGTTFEPNSGQYTAWSEKEHQWQKVKKYGMCSQWKDLAIYGVVYRRLGEDTPLSCCGDSIKIPISLQVIGDDTPLSCCGDSIKIPISLQVSLREVDRCYSCCPTSLFPEWKKCHSPVTDASGKGGSHRASSLLSNHICQPQTMMISQEESVWLRHSQWSSMRNSI